MFHTLRGYQHALTFVMRWWQQMEHVSLYGLCVILCAKGSTPNSTQELLFHKVPPILLNKPLSTILWRVGCTYSVCRFTQVYDIVNESVYQVYSKFRIQNSEFRIQNSEFRIWNSELWIVTEMKMWAIWAIVLFRLDEFHWKYFDVRRSRGHTVK